MNLLSQTSQFSDWYTKINELITQVNKINSSIGDLSELDTLNKTSLVNALLEKSPSFFLTLILED